MKTRLYIPAIAAAFACVLVTTSAAQADALISTFDSFTLDGRYGSWSNPATNVSGPTSLTVNATGFGGGFEDINPNLVAPGEAYVRLDATVNSGSAGFVLALVDEDGTLNNYAWFGLPVGSYSLTVALSAPAWVGSEGAEAGLNTSDLTFFHIQVDPGTYTGPYSVSFENLQLLTVVPEPASLALLAGAAGITISRQRRS